ncbi:MAG: hypothetical protein A2541_01910 [Candidatus Taylorbacteria bacterium RIFOXYD2_FULL_36_9]|uniref:Phosphatidic acid phosphatase type 2/haloperoxidase domain-containing protein n=1 Tax=Candidatus Taylorbacteria bacterium RIFOXYD2_FULL_36_9 TaxID=1802338 RepID=A0A1G2PGD1_9BACT|nr:MAG: hypothetical protein A2541_01910 [Candidatus Taylorbacteria bacterium RIFOXYD2_FULL_36_9]
MENLYYLLSNFIISTDTKIIHLLYISRTDMLVNLFYFITLFAESITIIIFSIILSVFLWIKRQHIYLFFLWFTLIIGEGLTFFGKHIFQRERPDISLQAITEDSFSFPSGHATIVILFYGFLVYLIIKKQKSLKIQIITLFLFIVAVILIDFSRLYLGVHYLSDVLAGNLVGLITLLLSISIIEWLAKHHK